jgi:hypothetical protein
MPTINGEFTVTWTANSALNTVEYTITGVTPSLTGTLPVNCTNIPGPCSVDIPITYTDPSCDTLTIEVIIYSDCDPDASITYTQSFPTDNQNCFMYEIECIYNQGCTAFNTLDICPTCVQVPSASNGIIKTYSITYNNSDFNTAVQNNYIPYNSTLRFCYDDLTRFEQIYGPPGAQEEYTIEPYSDGCCWECRTYQFTFDSDEIPHDFGDGPGIRIFPNIYPQIVGTSCDEVNGCYTPKSIVAIPISNATVYQPYIYTACLRKNSYTIMGNVYNVTVADLGPCTTP